MFKPGAVFEEVDYTVLSFFAMEGWAANGDFVPLIVNIPEDWQERKLLLSIS